MNPHADATAQLETGTITVEGIPTFFRRRAGEGPPAVFVHGVPTHSEDWLPVIDRVDGPVVALDLPGMGRSGRPGPEEFDSSMPSYAGFFDRFLEAMEIEEHSLVIHDWGSIALIGAQRRPERLRRLAVLNAVPLLPGYRWHRTARAWRTPVVGELSNRLWTRAALDLGLREARADWSRFDPEFVDMIWRQLDPGTFEAILRLYRSAPEDELAAAGRGLGRIRAPALVIWGMRDRYLPSRFGREWAEALADAELVELPEAGHWPWRDEPSCVDRLAAFLDG